MRKILMTSLCALFVFVATATAQTAKFGHFDSASLIEQLPEAKSIEKTLNDEASKVESQLNILQEDFQKQADTYQRTAKTMTAEQRTAKEAELGEMQQRIQVFVQTSRQDIQKKQQEMMQPLLQKILKAVQEVGANNGYLYIFERQSPLVLYSGTQSVDVTPEVKKRLGIVK